MEGLARQNLEAALAGTLLATYPERLEPPPSVATGYQLLPKIVDDPAPVLSGQRLEPVSYSWPWSETLIDNELKTIARLDSGGSG